MEQGRTTRRASRPPNLILGTDGPPPAGRPVSLGARALSRHRHVIGLSGYGKSKFLVSLALQLLNQGQGVAVLDPHGDLCLDILAVLERTGFFRQPGAEQRLLYLDFGRRDRFVPFNVLAQPYDDHQVARDLLKAFKRAWATLEGGSAPQLENLLLAGTLVLIQGDEPITSLPRLLTDAELRARLLGRVDDPQIVHFFQERFARLGKGAAHAIESTLRRLFLLTYAPALRYSLGQRSNLLQLRRQMDHGVAVLYNLAGLDEDSQRLLGCLIAVGYEVAALSREELPASRRRPYHLILDEFSMFSEQSEEALARTLDLTRKYGLFLTLAHQTWSQLSGRMRGALQNAVEVAFRLGHEDARWLAPRLTDYDPELLRDDPLGLHNRPAYAGPEEQVRRMASRLEGLEPRQAFVRIEGRTQRIWSLAVPDVEPGPRLDELIERYAQRLQTPRDALTELTELTDGSGERVDVLPDQLQPGAPATRRVVLVDDDDG